ncbi:histidine kinase [Adhaeribacter arboris]|uniref:Histidine kinase n=1 Tax=Adhaeribacter arboris TaxID=2072846 RepID=A0A2T2YID7_9BACT|nr:CBS domain-containing protein [Adhaeribacter arboris]PSR55273.1 histidine kinase [Adhaeribacter arboris]
MSHVKNILLKKGYATITIESYSTVYNALEMMMKKNVGALLVMDGEKFIGIFTERDYARKVILEGKASKKTLIKEIMNDHPVTVTPTTTIKECMNLMTDKVIRYLPVLEEDKVVGIISMSDIVKHLMEEQKFIIDSLQNYISNQ